MTSFRSRFFSPAKINLFFRIIGKRSDGYHEIASLYQAIDYGDWLLIEPSKKDQFTCSDPDLPMDETNLVSGRGLFRSHFPCPSVRIHLEKRIPMQAGLGGGSSNAATVLWALNEICHRPASVDVLCSIGAQIGSDVPFFFSTGTAYCTGRGEILHPVSILPICGRLIKPPFGTSTRAVYGEVSPSDYSKDRPEEALAGFTSSSPLCFNDLEKAAFRLDPRLAHFKRGLCEKGLTSPTMTGSGSAFFCLGSSIPKIENSIPFQSIQRCAGEWFSQPDRTSLRCSQK